MCQVGDKVLIRHDLSEMEDCKAGLVCDMRQYAGCVAEILQIRDLGQGLYEIDLDDEEWVWSSDCFEGVIDEDEIVIRLDDLENQI